jgi:hypothetical protein
MLRGNSAPDPHRDLKRRLARPHPGCALCRIVRVNADVPAVDLDADKPLAEINTNVLSEIDDRFCTVSSDTRHEDRSSPALVNCLGRLHRGGGKSLGDEFA